jgi:hypothetical protein
MDCRREELDTGKLPLDSPPSAAIQVASMRKRERKDGMRH